MLRSYCSSAYLVFEQAGSIISNTQADAPKNVLSPLPMFITCAIIANVVNDTMIDKFNANADLSFIMFKFKGLVT